MASILIVDDNRLVLNVLSAVFSQREYEVTLAQSGLEALECLKANHVDLILADVGMHPMDGLRLLSLVKIQSPRLPVVLMSGQGTEAAAVSAIAAGAFDYVTKPIRVEELVSVIRNALGSVSAPIADKNIALPAPVSYRFPGIVAESPEMQKVCESIEVAAITSSPVLLCGEAGTGKAQLARAIHECSPRKNGEFIVLNCAEMPEPVLEQQLFETTKRGASAAPQADDTKAGRKPCTILLDEVMMMPPGLLETLRLHLAGTGDTHRGRALARKASLILSADASLVSLSQAVESRDLLTKMSGVAIDLKPLRERTADLLPLLSHFFHEHTGDWSKLPVISPEAHSLLLRYSWPGNHTEVADLANDILPLVKNGTITKDILPAHIAALGAKDARETLGLSATQRGASLKRFLHDKLQKRTDSSVKPDSTVTEPAIAKRA